MAGLFGIAVLSAIFSSTTRKSSAEAAAEAKTHNAETHVDPEALAAATAELLAVVPVPIIGKNGGFTPEEVMTLFTTPGWIEAHVGERIVITGKLDGSQYWAGNWSMLYFQPGNTKLPMALPIPSSTRNLWEGLAPGTLVQVVCEVVATDESKPALQRCQPSGKFVLPL